MAHLKDLIVNGAARVLGSFTASSIIKLGGTSDQFLKADGSVSTLGTAATKNTVGIFYSVQHSDFDNNQGDLITRSFMSYWNGAYNSSGASNLTYCAQGTIIGSNNIGNLSVKYATSAGDANTVGSYGESSFFRFRGYLYLNNNYNANNLDIGEYIFRSGSYGNVGSGNAHTNALSENSTIQVFKNLQLSTSAWDSSVAYRVSWGGETNASRPYGWSPWIYFLSTDNYNNYVPTKTGVGASGTWGISISGNAATATSAGNANTLDNIDSTGFLRYYNSNTTLSNVDIVNTPSYVWTVSTTGGSISTATKPSGIDNAWGVIHLHTHSGNYATQLGFGGTTGRMYMRNAYYTDTFGSWKKLAFTSDIPTSLPANGGNADTVDNQHFSYSNDSNSPTYLWATNSNGSSFLAARGSISVNYANSAGSTSIITRTWERGNNALIDLANYHSQTRVFMADSDTTNKPSGAGAGFIISNAWDWGGGGSLIYQDFDIDYGRLYTNSKPCEGSYTGWKKVAWVDDIPTSLPANGGNADTVNGIKGAYIFRQIRSFGGASSDNTWIKIQKKRQYYSGTCLISVYQWGHVCSFIFSINNTYPIHSTLALISKDSGDLASNFRLSYSSSEEYFYFKIARDYKVVIYGSETEDVILGAGELVTSIPENLAECYNISINVADTAKSVDWSGVTNRPTNISQFNNDKGYVTTDTTYSTATSDTLGLVKIGYTANGKNYPVLLSNGQMYVNVPWTDTDTNTWRPITDSYSGTDSNTSLSQKGGKAIYDALVNGYASNAGSSTYSNTLEVLDVRGSDIIPSKFDPYRITGWFNESTGLLSGNWCSGITVKGWDDNYSSWQLAGYSGTSFGSHGLFFREAASDSGWRDWIQVITSDNISSLTVAIANLARTLSLDGTIKLYVHNNNELDFGGTNASTTIFFGCRAADNRAIPTSFVFGGSTGLATLTANGFIKKDSSDSYVLLGGGGHKALSLFVQTSGDQSISGTKTFSGTIKANRAESTTGFFLTSDIRYKNIIEYHYSLSNKIAQLPIIKYKWTDRDDDNIHIGSSALSVMNIIPELVSYDNNTDFYSLDYATLGAVAGISACKEVEMLKLKIKELELEIIILKSKYNG